MIKRVTLEGSPVPWGGGNEEPLASRWKEGSQCALIVPTLSCEGSKHLRQGRRPDFQGLPSDPGYRSGTVPDSHRLRDPDGSICGCREHSSRPYEGLQAVGEATTSRPKPLTGNQLVWAPLIART